jgi:energy-coupling factor transporter ATP-binding protein EcfA2
LDLTFFHSILDVLNLRHIKHQRIGNEEKRGISGGQRKRVNIAMELAAAPLVLFLDEPTTGLDASSALEVCEVLNKIAKLTCINVAVVIHQPRVEIWSSLDNLLILAPGGKTVFLGPQRYAQVYFTRHLGIEFAAYENPADTLMDAVSKYGISFADRWKQDGHKLLTSLMEDDAVDNKNRQISKNRSNSSSSNSSENNSQREQISELKRETDEKISYGYKDFNIKKVARRRGANFLTQLYLAHVRAVKQQAVGYLSLLIELGLSLIAGILIGLAASGAYKGILKSPYVLFSASSLEFIIPQKGLFMNVAVGLAASAAGVRTFGDERVIYWREAASGHNRASYFLGVTLSVLYRIALAALHFVIMLYVVGMPMASLGRMYLICLGIYFAVYGLGSLISMIFDRKDAPLTAVIATLVAAIMSGFITLFPYELKAISYAFWSSEAYYAGEVAPFANIYDLDLGSNTWDYNLDRFGVDMGAMIGLGVGYRVVAFIFMIILHRDKQK